MVVQGEKVKGINKKGEIELKIVEFQVIERRRINMEMLYK